MRKSREVELKQFIFGSFVFIGMVFSIFLIAFDDMSYKIGMRTADGKDIRTYAEMYTKEVKEFYYYNISRIGEPLTEEELREGGGVCSHYTDYIIGRATKDGLYTEDVVFRIHDMPNEDNVMYHNVAIISNDGGYCLIDSIDYHCRPFL